MPTQAESSDGERPSRKLGRAYCVPETGAVYFDGDLGYVTLPRGTSDPHKVWFLGPPESGLASERDLIKEEMGDWLGKLGLWDTFSTWTFARPTHVAGAMYMARRHFDWLQRVAGVPVYAFLAVEKGEVGGHFHLHSLVGNVGHLKAWCGRKLSPGKWGSPCCLLHAWPCGYARVFPYDPVLGAKHYVSKYVCGALAEWELRGFPAKPQLALASVRQHRRIR